MTGTVVDAGSVPPTEAERAFFERIARHWNEVHGVTFEQGRMMGWMMICDPPEQTLPQICAAVGAERAQIEPMIVHFVEAGMYTQIDRPGQEPLLRMADDGYPKVVAQTFASWPDYHRAMAFGLQVLAEADAPEERRRRLAQLEALYRSVVTDLAAAMDKWNTSIKASVE